MTQASAPKWQGYLTLGDINVQALLDGGLKACFAGDNLPQLPVEPGRVFSAAGLVRKSVEVWNQKRTRFLGDEYCLGRLPASDGENYILEYLGQPEHLRISGGFQMSVSQSGPTILVFRSSAGGGELGAPTHEIPLSDTELPPTDRTYLDGGLDCSEVLRSINGVGGPDLQMRSLQGVLIEPHPSLNRVVVDVNGESINYCPAQEAPTKADCVPPRDGGCGPIDAANEPCPGEPNRRGGYIFGGEDSLNPDYQGPVDPTIIASESIYGFCDYKRMPNHWELISQSPSQNCDCVPPTIYGYTGQQIRTPAAPLAVDPLFIIRNAYFTEQLRYWQSSGNTVVQGVPSLDYMTAAVLTGEAEITQQFIRISQSGKYRLQAKYALDTGIVLYALKNHKTEDSPILGFLDPSHTALHTDFKHLAAGDYKLTISSSNALSITEIGLVKWQ